MRVIPTTPDRFTPGSLPEIHLEPETDRDHAKLESMLAHGWLSGFGRNAVTGRIEHAQVMILIPQQVFSKTGMIDYTPEGPIENIEVEVIKLSPPGSPAR